MKTATGSRHGVTCELWETVDFHIEEDPIRCRMLWDMFSPKKSLFDLWEYRECFVKAYGYSLHFVVGEKDGDVCGVVPLWHDLDDGDYSFVGGGFPETNTFWIKDKGLVGEFLDYCPTPLCMSYISESEKESVNMEWFETRYFLDMADFGCEVDNLIASFDKKHRKNLRYDLRQIMSLNPKTVVNRLSDVDRMVELNVDRFGVDSDYKDPRMVESIRAVAELALSQGRLNLLSVDVGGKTEAVELAVDYNGCYHILAGGRNLGDYENIGKHLVVEHIRHALSKEVSILDFMSSDTGWKSRWHLRTEKLYRVKKQ